MAVSAAQLLDELMGRDRNRAPGEPSFKHHWSDPEVCKYFLCGFCPHELFTNTKADLGTCPKVHDEALKKEYSKSGRTKQMGYEDNFTRYLKGIMNDVDRRIRRGHERLALNAKKEKELRSVRGEDEKMTLISDRIKQLLTEIEALGSEGKVEEAQGMMKLVEQLKDEKETLVQMTKLNPLSSQEKEMEVCQVCGAFLIVGDAQSRVDDHLQGKQHVGYARIKSTLDDIQAGKWRTSPDNDEEEADEKERGWREEKEEKRDRSREGSRESSRRRYSDRDSSRRDSSRRDSSRRDSSHRDSRERRERERSRERKRDRDGRRRSRSRDRYRRRGSRDRGDRRRSRSGERRSSDRDRRRRSRSGERRSSDRDRRRRSRSGERRSSDRDRRRRSRSAERRSSDRDRRRSTSRERRRRDRDHEDQSKSQNFNDKQRNSSSNNTAEKDESMKGGGEMFKEDDGPTATSSEEADSGKYSRK